MRGLYPMYYLIKTTRPARVYLGPYLTTERRPLSYWRQQQDTNLPILIWRNGNALKIFCWSLSALYAFNFDNFNNFNADAHSGFNFWFEAAPQSGYFVDASAIDAFFDPIYKISSFHPSAAGRKSDKLFWIIIYREEKEEGSSHKGD
jgi:hypothetical protein